MQLPILNFLLCVVSYLIISFRWSIVMVVQLVAEGDVLIWSRLLTLQCMCAKMFGLGLLS